MQYLDFLPREIGANLTTLIKSMETNCESIYLTGSWVCGKASHESDIDLDIIVEQKNKSSVESYIRKNQSLKHGRTLFDCKVFTKEDLQRALDGLPHLFIWTRYSMGIPIIGAVMKLTLNKSRVRQYILHYLERMNGATCLLESGIETSKSIFIIYDTAIRFYFVKRVLLSDNKSMMTKHNLLKHFFGSEFIFARNNYNKINNLAKKSSIDFSAVRLKIKDTILLSEQKHEKFLDCADVVTQYAQDIYERAIKEVLD